jgi:hypothetical protein
MLKKVLGSVAALVAALAVIVALQPSRFRIARQTSVGAPASAVFALVDDLHRWEAWNPWQKVDPNVQNTYSGAESGPGASFAWAGNEDVGKGRMTIVDSRPGELVRIRLEFLEPYAATNTAEFTFEPQGDRTLVTWAMSGENSFLGKAIGLVMDMDRMIGDQFEKGLADLKAIAETSAQGRANT